MNKEVVDLAKSHVDSVAAPLHHAETGFAGIAVRLQVLLLTVEKAHRDDAWEELYYTSPSVNQITTLIRRINDALPRGTATFAAELTILRGDFVRLADYILAARTQLAEARQALKDARTALASYRGDATLLLAMAAPRAEYKARWVASIWQDIGHMEAKLAIVDWNIDLAYPYPGMGQTRLEYARKIRERKMADKIFRVVGSKSTVAQREDAHEIVDNEAERMTEEHFGGYVLKLSQKIGKAVLTAKLSGSLWSDCTLFIRTTTGETQTWHTHCIFNRSCLGKVFNQWPTRRTE